MSTLVAVCCILHDFRNGTVLMCQLFDVEFWFSQNWKNYGGNGVLGGEIQGSAKMHNSANDSVSLRDYRLPGPRNRLLFA